MMLQKVDRLFISLAEFYFITALTDTTIITVGSKMVVNNNTTNNSLITPTVYKRWTTIELKIPKDKKSILQVENS